VAKSGKDKPLTIKPFDRAAMRDTAKRVLQKVESPDPIRDLRLELREAQEDPYNNAPALRSISEAMAFIRRFKLPLPTMARVPPEGKESASESEGEGAGEVLMGWVFIALWFALGWLCKGWIGDFV
jgi:hypothetical protein